MLAGVFNVSDCKRAAAPGAAGISGFKSVEHLTDLPLSRGSVAPDSIVVWD